MRLPKLFRNARVYLDGNLLIGIAKFTLPELEYVTEEDDGFGYGGKIEIPTGMLEPITLKMSFRAACPEAFNLAAPIYQNLSFRGDILAYDLEGAESVSYPYQVDATAKAKKFPLGEAEANKAQDLEVEMTATALTVILDGNEMMDIDIFVPKLIINGTDYLADMAAHMGMN